MEESNFSVLSWCHFSWSWSEGLTGHPTTLLFPTLSSLLGELQSKVVIAGGVVASPGRLPALWEELTPSQPHCTQSKAHFTILISERSRTESWDTSLVLLSHAVPWAWQWPLSEGQCSVFSFGELRAVTALNHNLNTFCACLPVSCFLVTKARILHWGLLESQKIKDCNSIFLPLPQKVIQPLKCWKMLRGHYLSLGCSKGAEQAAHPEDNVKSSTRNQRTPICFSICFVAVQSISADW